MHLYFVYFHFSHKVDIFCIFVLYFSAFYSVLKFLSYIVLFFHEILYCIPVLFKKIAVGGLLAWCCVRFQFYLMGNKTC